MCFIGACLHSINTNKKAINLPWYSVVSNSSILSSDCRENYTSVSLVYCSHLPYKVSASWLSRISQATCQIPSLAMECRAGTTKKSNFFKLLEVPLSFTVKKKNKKKKKNPAASGKRTKLPWIILCLPVTKTDLCYFSWASDRG